MWVDLRSLWEAIRARSVRVVSPLRRPRPVTSVKFIKVFGGRPRKKGPQVVLAVLKRIALIPRLRTQVQLKKVPRSTQRVRGPKIVQTIAVERRHVDARRKTTSQLKKPTKSTAVVVASLKHGPRVLLQAINRKVLDRRVDKTSVYSLAPRGLPTSPPPIRGPKITLTITVAKRFVDARRKIRSFLGTIPRLFQPIIKLHTKPALVKLVRIRRTPGKVQLTKHFGKPTTKPPVRPPKVVQDIAVERRHVDARRKGSAKLGKVPRRFPAPKPQKPKVLLQKIRPRPTHILRPAVFGKPTKKVKVQGPRVLDRESVRKASYRPKTKVQLLPPVPRRVLVTASLKHGPVVIKAVLKRLAIRPKTQITRTRVFGHPTSASGRAHKNMKKWVRANWSIPFNISPQLWQQQEKEEVSIEAHKDRVKKVQTHSSVAKILSYAQLTEMVHQRERIIQDMQTGYVQYDKEFRAELLKQKFRLERVVAKLKQEQQEYEEQEILDILTWLVSLDD